MWLSNAKRKLERAGWTLTSNGNPFWTYRRGRAQIDLGCNPAESDAARLVVMIDCRRVGDRDEPETDYHAGTFVDSVSAAIYFCWRMGYTEEAAK